MGDSLQMCWEAMLNQLREHCPDSYEAAREARQEALGQELAKNGIDLSSMQYNGTGGLSILDWELNIHKSVALEAAMDGGIQRVVHIVRFWVVTDVAGQSKVLMERKT